jgi:translation elongation factor EF-Ts
VDGAQLRGVLAALSSETEFVAMTEDFRTLAARIARASAESGLSDVDSVLELSIGGATARSALADLSRRSGVSCRLEGLDLLDQPGGYVGCAVNKGANAAALVQLGDRDATQSSRDHCELFAKVLMDLESSARERGAPGLVALSQANWVLDGLVSVFVPHVRVARCLVRSA